MQEDHKAEIDHQSETVKHGLEEDNLNKLARQIGEQLAQESKSPALIIGSCRLFECGLMMVAGIIAYGMQSYPDDRFTAHMAMIAALSVAIGIYLHFLGQYTTYSLKRGRKTTARIFLQLTSAFGLIGLLSLSLGAHDYYAPSWIINWYLLAVIGMIITRLCLSFAISHWDRNGYMERRAVLVGGGQPAEKLIRALEADRHSDIRICGIFDDRKDERSAPMVAGYPKLGRVRDVVAFARRTKIDLIILTLPLSAEQRWIEMLKFLWVLPVDIRLAAHTNSHNFKPRFYSYENQSNIPMLSLFDKPISDWASVSKRIFDLVFATIALLLLWPLMVATAIAIKLESKGSILFKQKRHGINNEEIMVYKFRSMYSDMADAKAAKMVTRNDPRVTRVGRIIRKTSIDELPQLFNVFLGNLSLVGPRPHAVVARASNRYFANIADGYFARHRVKPGITGWAQINGLRGEITSDEKLEQRTQFDLYYIENWSVWFDFVILMKTPLSLLNTENAY